MLNDNHLGRPPDKMIVTAQMDAFLVPSQVD
jgi:hypothetical protein